MESGVPSKARLGGRRLLLRGESLIASTGLILAAILLVVMAATSYWTSRTQRHALEAARTEEIRSLGELLSDTAGLMLSVQELTNVRRLVADMGRSSKLDSCRVVLADGRVLADANPSGITEASLPEAWVSPPISSGIELSEAGVVKLTHPVEIRDRGTARLEIVAPVHYPQRNYWEAQIGVAAIGAGALFALLFMYRRLRARFLALGVIRDALLNLDGSDDAPFAPALDEGLGREAKAWNRLLAEKEQLRQRAMCTRVAEALTTRPESDRQLSEVCDMMRQGVIIIDKNQRTTYANGAAAVYLGRTVDELIGASTADLMHEPETAASLEAAVTQGVRSWTCVEIDRRGQDTNSVLRFCVRPLRREDPGAAMITIEDVTQQRVAEEARNSFITQVTHELRAPLTNIRLSAETAIEDGEDSPQTRAKCLNVINQEAQRLERVVSDMLSVAEIEAGTMDLRRDDVRLEELFERLQADYAAQVAEKSITLEFKLPPKLPVLHADREKISLALHNLINNAVKYTPEGGRVAVNVDTRADRVVVEVTDSGIGIAESDLGKIFDKFYRADDTRLADITGSGLGLALTQEVVHLHGGEIDVQSEIDKGSTFTVTLPITAQAA